MDCNPIKFSDFFKLDFPERTKVKFNMNNADTSQRAWDYLLNDSDKWIEMSAYKRKHANNNLNHADYLLAFAQYYPYGPNFYIFGGMYRVKKKEPEIFEGIGYDLELLPDYIAYRKRLIIRLNKPIGRNIYNRPYFSVIKSLDPEVYEIAPATKLGAFPGYSKVLLSHKDLEHIIRNEASEWKNALSSVKGVYCITDCSNGKIYIGSAAGDTGGIWQRWEAYANAKNLTGGNKAFEELKATDINHITDNFSYSILEIFDMRAKREDIIQRESYWKQVFQTIKFGMNNN